MSNESLEFIEFKRINDYCWALYLNRPEKRNALNSKLLESLSAALHRAEEAKITGLFLAAKGDIFCAGLDLKEAQDLSQAHQSAQLVAKVLKQLYYAPYFTLSVVQGGAVAGGAGIMSACDMTIAANNSYVAYPETRRGLIAGLVMTFLKRQVGEKKMYEILLEAEPIPATEAMNMGLINKVVPLEKLYDEALKIMEKVLLGAPQAIKKTKQMVKLNVEGTVDQDITEALKRHMEARVSEESAEGFLAFFDKRKPSWVDKQCEDLSNTQL